MNSKCELVKNELIYQKLRPILFNADAMVRMGGGGRIIKGRGIGLKKGGGHHEAGFALSV